MSRSVPTVLQIVSKIIHVGTNFDVLVSVDTGAIQVQIKSQLQYNRGSWSDVKLLIRQYKQEYFQVLRDSNLPADEPLHGSVCGPVLISNIKAPVNEEPKIINIDSK